MVLTIFKLSIYYIIYFIWNLEELDKWRHLLLSWWHNIIYYIYSIFQIITKLCGVCKIKKLFISLKNNSSSSLWMLKHSITIFENIYCLGDKNFFCLQVHCDFDRIFHMVYCKLTLLSIILMLLAYCLQKAEFMLK